MKIRDSRRYLIVCVKHLGYATQKQRKVLSVFVMGTFVYARVRTRFHWNPAGHMADVPYVYRFNDRDMYDMWQVQINPGKTR